MSRCRNGIGFPLLVGVASLLCGCVHVNRPSAPPTIGPHGNASYSVTDFKSAYTDYQASVGRQHWELAKVQRDAMINRIEVDIEANYRDYEGQLLTTRASLNTTADVAQLGLSAAIGVTGASSVKDLLAASLTSFQGARLSFDKNFFREKTTEILIAKMQGSRDTIRNRITTKMALPVQQYPFEEAWRDLVEFFYSGTLQSALIQLANDAGAGAAKAKQQSEEIDIKRAFSAEEAGASARIRTNYAQLYHGVMESKDTSERANALATLKEVLMALGESKDLESKKPEELLELLRQHMQQALSHPEDIPKLDKLLTQQR